MGVRVGQPPGRIDPLISGRAVRPGLSRVLPHLGSPRAKLDALSPKLPVGHEQPRGGDGLFVCEFQQHDGVARISQLAIASQVLAFESGANFIGCWRCRLSRMSFRMREPILEQLDSRDLSHFLHKERISPPSGPGHTGGVGRHSPTRCATLLDRMGFVMLPSHAAVSRRKKYSSAGRSLLRR
jgi:hypothetical protein